MYHRVILQLDTEQKFKFKKTHIQQRNRMQPINLSFREEIK